MTDPREIEGTPERAADRGRAEDLEFGIFEQPSLGNLDVVRELVSEFAGKCVDIRKRYNGGTLDGDDARAELRKLSTRYGDIVMGRGEGYHALPWHSNGPGRLGSRIRQVVPAERGINDPGELLFLTAGTSIAALSAAHEEDRITDHDAEQQLQAMLADLANLIAGLPR